MPKINRLGDKRGMTEGSKKGLEKARQVRRSGPNRGKAKAPASKNPLVIQNKFSKLIHGSLSQLNPRVQDYVKLIEDEPGAVTASILGMLLAEMDAANKTLAKIWKWLDEYLDPATDGFDSSEDPPLPPDPRAITKILSELRKWSQMLHESGIKIAEIRAKTFGRIDEQDPLNAYEIDSEEIEEQDDQDAAVSILDDTGSDDPDGEF